MVPLLTLFIYAIYLVATSPNTESGLSGNVSTESGNYACTEWKSINGSSSSVNNKSGNVTPKNLREPCAPTFDNSSSLPASRRAKRQAKNDPPVDPEMFWKTKAINMMKQAMYASQEIIWKIEPNLRHMENNTDYRMAFIFMKLQQLMKDSRSIISFVEQRRIEAGKKMAYSMKDQRLQLYWQLVRKNVDATALVDYIIERVPQGTADNDSRGNLTGP